MHITCLYRLIPFLFLICLSNTSHASTQQDAGIWTLSGSPAHLILRHYVGLSGQSGSAGPQAIDLQNDALKLDETELQRDRDRAPRLVSAILSPDLRFLMCHWIGIWRDGAYSVLCVYDVRDGKLLLNVSNPSRAFYEDCDWLNADEIWFRTRLVSKAEVSQKQPYYAVPVVTGQPHPFTDKELHATISALHTSWKPIETAAKAFKSLGFKPRPTREMGQSTAENDLGSRHMSSHGAVSSDGKFAVLTKFFIQNNTLMWFYQIISGGKPSSRIDRHNILSGDINRVSFVDDMFCISVAKDGRPLVQVWTVEQKPRLVARLDGEWVVDRSLIREQ